MMEPSQIVANIYVRGLVLFMLADVVAAIADWDRIHLA